MVPSLPAVASASILVVDDNLTNLNILVNFLKDYGFKLLIARDGATALTRAELVKPDLILLDVMMPDLNGFEVCKRLKDKDSTRDIPIIFMTALDSIEDKVRGFEVGAVDYVTKPIQQAEVLARITTHLRLRALARQLQAYNVELEQQVAQRTQELSQAYAKLEKIDRHKADFIKIAAHELRTPLTMIEGYAQLLRHERSQKMLPEMVGAILQGTHRLGAIINSMLDIARIDAELVDVLAEETSLSSILEGVTHALTPALQERNLTLKVNTGHLPFLTADPDLLYKVFSHVIINAIKYTPDGKAIYVDGLTTPATNAQPAGMQITVRDEGIGIDPAYHELIFEKFFQPGSVALHSSGLTKFKGGGPGLGLAIARGIVQAHRGRIWVESSGYDEATCPGCVFHIWLPLQYIK